MIYLIGGPARCGKSTLAKRFRREIDGQVLSGDAFVKALQATLEPRTLPDVFDRDVVAVGSLDRLETKVDRLRRRDEMMWQFYEAYIHTAVADAPQDDLLLEGNLWPDYLELLPYEHRAVFLIDTSKTQFERLKNIRDGVSDNNWMQEYDDDKLKVWSEFNSLRSRRYVELCKKLGYEYFDVAKLGIEAVEQAALEYLRQKAV